MNIIDHYEPALTRYKGTAGNIHFAENHVVALEESEMVQREDGAIVFGCVSRGFLPPEGATFQGKAADGKSLKASRVYPVDFGQLDSEEKFFYVGLPAHLSVNRPAAPTVQELRFMLVNLRRDQRSEEFSPLSMTLGGHVFDVAGADDYRDTIKRIRATGETKITAVCTVKRTDGAAIIERLAVHWMHYACTLLSLARGNKVTWIRYETTDEKTGNTYYVHSAPKTKPFSMQMSILGFEPDFAACTEDWSRTSASRSERKYLSSRVDYLLDGLGRDQFLQGNALAAAALVDALTNQHAVATDSEYKLEDEEWNPIRNALEKCIKGITKPDGLNLIESLRELRRVTFRSKLTKMLTDLDVQTDYIDELKRVRDSLVHTGDFPPGTTRQGRARAYAVLVWTAYAVLMRLSGYQGSVHPLAEPTGT